jgi:surface protein
VGNLNGVDLIGVVGMFEGCRSFNQNLMGLKFKTSNLNSLLAGCSTFNQPLNDLDVSNVTSTDYLFDGCTAFTSDLSAWDVSSLKSATAMLRNTSNFDSDLNWWCVSNITTEPENFATGSFLARSNYPKWGTCPVRDVSLTIDIEAPFLIVGSTGTLTYLANKPITEESVVWSSSNPSAVTINETTGEYAVIDAGGATITVTVNGIYTTTRTYEAVPAITPAVMVVAQHVDPLTIRLDSDTTRTSEAYVDWGDGTFDHLTSFNSLSKTYTTAGPFNVSVMPSSPIGSGLVINGDGVTALTAFGECDISITSSNLESVPARLPSNVTSLGTALSIAT